MTQTASNIKNSNVPLVLGIDIGATNTGWSVGELRPTSITVIDSGCVNVKTPEAKYKGTQNVLKAMEMLKGIEEVMRKHNTKIHAIAVETPGGNTQSAAAAKALGMCATLVAFIAKESLNICGCSVVLVKPNDVKKVIKGTERRSVDKNEIMEYVEKHYGPNIPGVKYKDQKPVKASFEHIADSVLVMEAAKKTSKLFEGLLDD